MPSPSDKKEQCLEVMKLALQEIEMAKEKGDQEGVDYWVDQYSIYHRKFLHSEKMYKNVSEGPTKKLGNTC